MRQGIRMPPSELPPDLGPHFGVTAARVAGVPRSRLRASDLDAGFHGSRSTAEVDGVEPEDDSPYPRSAAVKRIHERARQYVPVMAAHSYFSHITAAALWDVPLPGRSLDLAAAAKRPPKHPVFDPEILQVSVPWPARAPRGAGVIGHAVRPELAVTRAHPTSGLALASPATTWVQLAGLLPHRNDLIAVADHFVRVPRHPHGRRRQHVEVPLATLGEFQAALDAGRRRGMRQLEGALAMVRTGSSSRLETWARLTLIDAGLPEPVLDFDVIDDDGRFLGCLDMAYPRERVAVEAEGRHHAAVGQWEADIDRYAGLEAAGWRIIRVTARMVFVTPAMFVSRVRAALLYRAA